MAMNFHRDMDKYLTSKRRKRLFSGIKSRIMNKKAAVSYKAASGFGQFREKLNFKTSEISGRKKEPEKEITQEQIDYLVEKNGINRDTTAKIKSKAAEDEEGGWKEVKLYELQGEDEELTSLEEEKRKIEEDIARVHRKEEAEKERLARLSEENEQREKKESGEDRLKRLELEEEVKILKEKQKIEEDRLDELRKARKREQMEALKGRVMDILFKKKPRKGKDMAEEVRKEIRIEAKVKAERQKAELKGTERLKEDVAKVSEEATRTEEKEAEKPKEEVTKAEEKPKERGIPEEVEKKEEPNKSFFSNFIQIRTAEQIAKEEEERLKMEEEQALNDQSQINALFEQEGEEVRSNVPNQEESVNNINLLSTLFPVEENTAQRQAPDSEGVISLDGDYKIKVVKN